VRSCSYIYAEIISEGNLSHSLVADTILYISYLEYCFHMTGDMDSHIGESETFWAPGTVRLEQGETNVHTP
jgi:hypothetical protein